MKFYVSIILLDLVSWIFPALLSGQDNVGINTLNPFRSLEVVGSQDQYVRVHTISNSYEAALELILGASNTAARDYKFTNDVGVFKIITNTDNFETAGEEIWRIDANLQVGIGTTVPTSRLHINSGLEASNTGDGYMMIGSKTAANLVFDPNEIIGRSNDLPNSILLQSHDGDAYFGNGGGNTYLADGGGFVGIGTSSPASPLTLEDEGFQIHLHNNVGPNDWYIGASSTSWSISDNQLVFSPNSTSDASVLRMQDVTENGGVVAPVMIRSGANQTLLLDGNEIDTKSGPLYINHNSNEETYINPSGGRVGMGNSDPSSTLHITTQDDEYALRLQRGSVAWDLNPEPAYDWLAFEKENWTLAHVDGASGQWVTISDRRMKENIVELPGVMDKIKAMKTYTYSFIHDTTHTPQIGIIAQEVASLFPEIVEDNGGQFTVGYSKLSVILLKALQEQQKEIEALQHELTELTAVLAK